MALNKSQFGKIHQVLSNPNRLEEVEFNSPSQFEQIQMCPETTYRKEMRENYFDEDDRYAFLFSNENRYKNLYHFLQTNREFLHFQLREIKLYMGLFAYADYDASATLGLRYLYGPMDLNIEQGKPKPNFYLKSFYHNGTDFAEEQPEHLSNSMETFYYARSKMPLEEIDFIRILQDEKVFQHKRTQFEKDNNVIYAPSGEMDGCILMMVFLLLELSQRDRLFKELSEYKQTGNDNLLAADDKRFRLDFELLKPLNVVKQDYVVPFENRAYSLWQWLKVFGLIAFEEGKEEQWIVTERGVRLLKWMEAYCGSIIGANTIGKNYHGILELIEMDKKSASPDEVHNYWLEKINPTDLREVCQLFADANEEAWTLKHHRKLFLHVMRLMLQWQEPGRDGEMDQISNFQKRCRFNLFSHFVLRAGDRGKTIETVSRGWIVFPILTENMAGAESNQVSFKNVGFFLGTFKDSTGEGLGYFENLGILSEEFNDILFKTKVIIGKLAEIENREIYYDGIYEARLSKDLFFKLHHAQHTYFNVLKIIAGELKEESKHIFTLAHDCVARYLDIAKYLPNRLDKYLKGYTTERLSITEVIKDVIAIINVLFLNDEAAMRIFKIDEPFIAIFQDRAAHLKLISLDNRSVNHSIEVNKGVFVLILKELFINALRNTYRGDPHVFVVISDEGKNTVIAISNHYRPGSNIEKTAVSTFGQKIVEELINGLGWKCEKPASPEIYTYQVIIPCKT